MMKIAYHILIYLCLVYIPSLFAYDYELSIAAIFRDEAPYLKEWIDYHRLAGVDHFWLYDDVSTDDWQKVLKPYIEKGIVEVFDWSECRNTGMKWPGPQIAAYKDALHRALGRSKWIALIDIDEFILPMIDSSIPECLRNHFSDASGVYVTWRNFGTGGIYLKESDPLLFHLTACSQRNHGDNVIGKSILRPEHTQIDKLWYVHHCALKPGYQFVTGDGDPIKFEEFIGKNGSITYDMHNHFHYDKFIRINHYFFRDENFFQNVKLERKRKRGVSDTKTFEQYAAYSMEKDEAIMNYLKKYHARKAKKIWNCR